jgi:hypothetical protein
VNAELLRSWSEGAEGRNMRSTNYADGCDVQSEPHDRRGQQKRCVTRRLVRRAGPDDTGRWMHISNTYEYMHVHAANCAYYM